MPASFVVEGSMSELRILAEELALNDRQRFTVQWPPDKAPGLMDDDNLGISPWGYFVVVYTAHLSADGTMAAIELLRDSVKKYRTLRIKPSDDDPNRSDGP